jgi:hypothetical protein
MKTDHLAGRLMLAIRTSTGIASLAGAGFCFAQAPMATPSHVPPHAVGNEANAKQLALATRQGAAYAQAVSWERAGAGWSADAHAGDLEFTVTLTPGEGGWDLGRTGLAWSDPSPSAVHLRAFVADAADGRFVPGLTLHAHFLDGAGTALGEALLPAGIYPLTDAYGSDVELPSGTRALSIVVEPMPWRRHDPYNGDRFSEPTVASFALSPNLRPAGMRASERAEHAPPKLKAALDTSLDDTIDAMWKQANAGARKDVADMAVVYAVEYAEAYWEFRDGKFRYAIENENSSHRNAHVEIAPRDALTGNFLPAVEVTATLIGPDGAIPPSVDDRGQGGPTRPGNVPLMWHSWLYHYGENWRVPKAGSYKLRVHVEAPTSRRYGKASGNRLASPVDVEFDDVTIKTGQK